MPVPPNVPGVLKVIFKQQVGNDAGVGTRLYFSYSGGAPSDATCLLIAEQAWLAYSNYLGAMLSSDDVFLGVDVIDMTSPTSGAALYLSSTPGTRTPAPLAAPTCSLFNGTVLRRYRGGKPRSYWPFGTYSDLANPSQWSTTYITAVTTAMDAFLAHMLAITESGTSLTSQVNVSLYSGFTSVENPVTHRWRNIPTYRTGTIPVDDIVSYSINAKPGTQRRRALHSS